jgi:hypothetical protein
MSTREGRLLCRDCLAAASPAAREAPGQRVYHPALDRLDRPVRFGFDLAIGFFFASLFLLGLGGVVWLLALLFLGTR